MSSAQRAHLANEAGQLFEVRTVEAFTGVTINHFVESNLVGFYSLAAEFGGIEVCIKPAPAQGGFAAGANLTDYDPQTGTDNSGFDAYKDGYNKAKGGAQYLHLSAAQSLAFVRSRDTLPGVDIGRTYRQQAAIDYVIYQLKHGNYFSDLGKISAILGSASSYLITDQDFNLIDFATKMQRADREEPEGSRRCLGRRRTMCRAWLPGRGGHHQRQRARDPAAGEERVLPAAGRAKDAGGQGGHEEGHVHPGRLDRHRGRLQRRQRAGCWPADVSQALGALGYKAGAVDNATAQSQTVAGGNPGVLRRRHVGQRGEDRDRGRRHRHSRSRRCPPGRWRCCSARPHAVPAGLAPSPAPTASTQSTSAQVIGAPSSGASRSTTATATPNSGIVGRGRRQRGQHGRGAERAVRHSLRVLNQELGPRSRRP